MARLAAGAALDKKALDPLVLDLRGISSVAEFFVILTGTSDRHAMAVAGNVMDAFKALGIKPLGEEGAKDGKWILLDFGEIVVHVFLESVREYYDIERLWIDAPRLDLEEPGADGSKDGSKDGSNEKGSDGKGSDDKGSGAKGSVDKDPGDEGAP